MKRLIALLLIMVFLSPLLSCAEHSTEDFSWLDDMTINQLKALDAEIHRRLPMELNEMPDDTLDESIIIGDWECDIEADIINFSSADSRYGHHIIRTYHFYMAGAAKYELYDATDDKITDSNTAMYEINSKDTIIIKREMLYFGTQVHAFTLSKDEEGIYLTQADNGFVYRKKE